MAGATLLMLMLAKVGSGRDASGNWKLASFRARFTESCCGSSVLCSCWINAFAFFLRFAKHSACTCLL